MRAKKAAAMIVVMGSLALAGCATMDSNVPAGAGLGAGAGALLGYGLTGSGVGAAAGAGAGMLAGAITGTVMDHTSRRSVPATPARSYGDAPAYEPAPQAFAGHADPTRGELLNATTWRLEIFVDSAGSPLHLGSRQSYPVSLDIGRHRIVAKAYVATQFGERLVGTYDRHIFVDPKSSGWSLKFDEAMF